MKLKLFFLVLSTLLILSCSDNEPDVVNIRLSNTSAVKFENATFNNVNFGDLNSNEKTGYLTFEEAYHYGRVKITINGQNYGWTPIDFVGETPLENGNYTFEYSFNTTTEVLTDRLIKD